LGTKHLFNSVESKLDVDVLKGSYLGSSEGYNEDDPREIVTPQGQKVTVTSCAQKVEMMQANLNCVQSVLRGEEPPQMYTKSVPKIENIPSFDVPKAQWSAKEHKVRMFQIMCGKFVLFERLISKIRHMIERGGPITIGHKWPYGGMDRLRKLLKILPGQIFLKILVEGDVKKFDYGVWAKFVDLFYSSMLIYEKPNGPHYWAKKKLLKVVIGEVLCRVTHMFGPVWGQVVGGVPSGCYNTSHMDSWVMLLWIALFCIYQVVEAPLDKQEKLEQIVMEFFCIDNLWR